MSWVNWQKKFSHCSISGLVAPSSMQKLWSPLATIFVEKKIWKNFWCGFRPILFTPSKELLISWKKWRFEIFRTSLESRASDPCLNTQFSVVNHQYHKSNKDIVTWSWYPPCEFMSIKNWMNKSEGHNNLFKWATRFNTESKNRIVNFHFILFAVISMKSNLPLVNF